MEIQEYFRPKKELYNLLIDFIDDDESMNLFDDFQKLKIQDKDELRILLNMLSNISSNHRRSPEVTNKIEKIILNYEPQIKENFSNSEIFEIFKNNNLTLLFLLSKKFWSFDDEIIKMIEEKIEDKSEDDPLIINFCLFFHKEITEYHKNNHYEGIVYKISQYQIDSSILSYFEQQRLEGQNESIICCFIQNDSIEDFISYTTRHQISINSQIEPSIFETNHFLIRKQPTLIEYAAFYGSIQIFQYLCLNNAKLEPSIWLYAIHSNNADLIHLIEKMHIEMDENTFAEVYKEAIKCHHNKMAEYIKDVLLTQVKFENYNNESDFVENDVSYCLHYYNYTYLPNDTNYRFIFFYLVKYNYSLLVKSLVKTGLFNINAKIISI